MKNRNFLIIVGAFIAFIAMIFVAPAPEASAQVRRYEVKKARRTHVRHVRRVNRRVTRRVTRRTIRRHYVALPRYRAAVVRLPAKHVTVVVGGRKYWYHNGIYYARYNNGYRVVVGPAGVRVRTIPIEYANVVRVNNRPYYYYYDTFYVKKDTEYLAVAPPTGAVVDEIPEGAEKIDHADSDIYSIDGTYYELVDNEGEDAYEVVDATKI